ncbi:InlB B-repeat-containing protein [Pseudoflavonifractor phocaeensis]|uniref:FISUMP domain-containing protein n=1 Tax=Pseudoflavonifractor phocaeensis TaxID=1870988 RepID=UPI001959B87D|nr:FISUMP domain-containing protein [Pseudoflavonifractor phocaeensis]MBM6937366.1 InlB B-repeat-containing protein [Pseudoflavonifractor phocaeensis]
MKRKQPFWVRLFSPVRLKTQRIYVAGSHPRVRLAAFNVFVGIGSFLVAFLLGSVLMIPGESSAEDVSTLANDASLSAALTPEAMNLAVTPTPGGTLASDELAIQVSTDNTTGYTLTLALAGAETSLNDPASGGKIQSSIADINSPATLSVNTWGWYPDSLANNTGNLFSALPSNSDPYELKKTSSPTSGSGETTTISFGVNVDTTLPAGSYTNAIVISAVTNYVPQPILDVYPTTGWAGDTITIYSNGGFVNVQSVTIGGTDCTSIDVKSADELTCTLPSKAETDTTSGTDNGYSISVTASNTSLDTHNFTIRYFNPNRTETASVSNTQITNTNMSSFTGVDCGSLSVGDIVSLTDERNGQTYRIKKMQDNKCWMVDNLKYAGEANTDLANVDGTYGLVYNNEPNRWNTVDGTSTESAENFDKAFYNNPMSASYCYGDSIQSSYTKCGYLYNWYAATAGTGTYDTYFYGTNVSGSICPTGWRLPSAMSDGSTATGNGTSYTAADFAVLNASMNAGSLTSGSTSNYLAGWLFAGTWSGVFSGHWSTSFVNQGSYGYYWSSTVYNSTSARSLYFNSSNVTPGDPNERDRYRGLAVRCVMDSTGVQITYDANGGYFDNDPSKTTELITYQIAEGSTETKIAKTSNISDDGTQSGGYGDNVSDTQTVTIPGASSLRVTVTYQTESTSFDWLAIYDGSVTPSQSNYADSITGKLGGTTKVENQVFIIPGDTAQFYFRSDSSSSNYYGYYAIVQEELAITPSGEVSTPTRPGYVFMGWYTDSAGTAGNEFTVNPSMESGTVYAKWGQNYLDDVTYMQDLTATQCSDSYDGATATLKDRRDNNSYTIAKINGSCWMTQNLRLAGGTTLTSTYSNVSSSYTIPTTDLTSGNSYTDGRIHNSGNTTTGYWYNYCAASAGTVCSRTQQDASYDICPKGWRLPTKTEFDGISGTSYISAFSPVTGGFYVDGSLFTTSNGYWWSSTASSSNDQYRLSYNGSSLGTHYDYKHYGYYVRCIRDTSIDDGDVPL